MPGVAWSRRPGSSAAAAPVPRSRSQRLRPSAQACFQSRNSSLDDCPTGAPDAWSVGAAQPPHPLGRVVPPGGPKPASPLPPNRPSALTLGDGAAHRTDTPHRHSHGIDRSLLVGGDRCGSVTLMNRGPRCAEGLMRRGVRCVVCVARRSSDPSPNEGIGNRDHEYHFKIRPIHCIFVQ